MDTSMITKRLYNKSVQWIWEAKDKGYDKVSTYYDKIANVSTLKEMEGDPAILTSGVGPQVMVELQEKKPITFVDPIEGYTVHIKRRDFALGSETSMKLEDDAAIAGIESFFKKYINENVMPAIGPTIDTAFASLYLQGAKTAGHDIFDNSTKGLADPSGKFIYDGKPFLAASGNNHVAKGHSTTYYNHMAATSLDWDNAKTADVLLRATNAYMENGQPFDNTRDLAVMVPTSLGDTARVIFNTEKDPTSAENGINPLKGRYEIIENPYLNSNANGWVLLRKKFGIKMFVNATPVVRYWADEENRLLRCSAVITIGLGVTNWRGTVGAYFTAS